MRNTMEEFKSAKVNLAELVDGKHEMPLSLEEAAIGLLENFPEYWNYTDIILILLAAADSLGNSRITDWNVAEAVMVARQKVNVPQVIERADIEFFLEV